MTKMDKKKEALKEIKEGGFSLQYADEKLKADKEVVLAAVKKDGTALEYADKKLKADKEVVLAAVKQSYALQYANEELKADKEVVLAAIKQDGRALEYADEKLKGDKKIVLAAVKQAVTAFKYAADNIKKNIGASYINYKKLKKDMDEDGDFLHWDTDEKVSITRTGSGNETDYWVHVESDQDEDTSEYDVYGEFGSSIDEIESAVECFLENGGDIMSFNLDGYLNAEKIFIELKKI